MSWSKSLTKWAMASIDIHRYVRLPRGSTLFFLHQNVKHLETSWATSDLFVFRHLSSSYLRFVRALCFNCETPGGHGSMVNIASPNHRIPLSENRILKYPKIFITTFRIISWPIQKFITSALPATEASTKSESNPVSESMAWTCFGPRTNSL